MDMKNTLLVDAFNPEMKTIAHIQDGVLKKIYFDLSEREDILNNIYLGKVINVVPSLSAYFVDYGAEKNGFLSFNSCSKTLNKDDMLIVQASKNEKEHKGAKLNSVIKISADGCNLLSDSLIAGHLKVSGDGDREKLVSLWNEILENAKITKKPGLLYRDDLIIQRIINKSNEPVRILVDSDHEFEKLKPLGKAGKCNVEQYSNTVPIMYQFNIADDVKNLGKRSVPLEKGAVIVIDTAEAMCCIDVNSSSCLYSNLEETSLKVNLAAAHEIAKQIRLRDLSGIIAIDFIDMYNRAHIAQIEDTFAAAMQQDTASIRIAKINEFGMLILSRQRSNLNVYDTIYKKCGNCAHGMVQNTQWIISEILSELRLTIHCNPKCEMIKVRCSEVVAEFMLNNLRRILCDLEDLGPKIQIKGDLENGFEITPPHNFAAPKVEKKHIIADEVAPKVREIMRYHAADIPLFRPQISSFDGILINVD